MMRYLTEANPDYELTGRSILYSLRYYGTDETIRYIFTRCSRHVIQNLIPAIQTIDEPTQHKLMWAIIRASIDLYQAELLFQCQQAYPDIMQQVLRASSQPLQERAKHLLAMPDKEKRFMISDIMTAFTPRMNELTYEAGLLIFAAIRAKKPYPFNPTLLRSIYELAEYVDVLRQQSAPFRERFVLAEEDHWICGDIQCDDNGKVNILIYDSLGVNRRHPEDDMNDSIRSEARNTLQLFAEGFPQATIYFPDAARQHDNVSCKVFSMDNAIHFFTLERYLGPEFKESGFFGYLKAQGPSEGCFYLELDEERVKVTCCHLPLSLERNWQSRTLLKHVIPGRSPAEQARTVNAKGENARQSAMKFFEGTSDGRTENRRLVTKYQHFIRDVGEYIIKMDKKVIEKTMKEFTLLAFKKRVLGCRSLLKRQPNVMFFWSPPDGLSGESTLLYKVIRQPRRFR